MTVKTVRNIKEETWQEIKTEAAKRSMNMNDYFDHMLKSSKKYEKLIWDHVLHPPKNLTNKEAEEMKKHVKKLRSEKGFRI
jgi:hypothetical protein